MKIDIKNTLFLIDGSGFLYRAYYGVKPLHTSQGVPVQAVYSFCRMIKKLMNQFHPHFMALVWDSKGKTTRHTIYPEYKQTRQEAPSDIFEQKNTILEFADLIGLASVAKEGVEADDLIYSIAKECSDAGGNVVVVSSDKDLLQILNEKITLFDPFKDRFFEQADAQELLGFPVEHLPLFYGLVGDASDNIPGVAGIGKKTAQDLAVRYSSMEDLYAHLDDPAIAERTRRALLADRDNAFLSRDLFLLVYYPLNTLKELFVFDEKKWSHARSLFATCEFRSLVAEIDKGANGGLSVEHKLEALKKYNFITVTTEPQLIDLVSKIKKEKLFAIDTEGTRLQPLESKLVGISICFQEGTAYYIPFGHLVNEVQLTQEQVFAHLKPILEDEQYRKYMHHAKFDLLALYAHGIDVKGLHFDTMIAAHLLAQDWQRVGLKALSAYYFKEEVPSFKEIVMDHGYTNFSQVPLALATVYSACDAHQTWRLAQILIPDLKTQHIDPLYYTLELPLVQVLFEMERMGIIFDVALIKAVDKKVSQELEIVKQQILDFWTITDTALNINSRQHIQKLLFEILGLPVQKKSPKGGASTDQEVLEELAKMHPAPALIVRYRELFKLKSTYIDALPTYVSPHTKRIHTTFSQTSVATGRLSSSEPNLQNIPVDSGYGIEIRAAFKPEQGHLFLSADYSQIELRVLAHLSQDKALLRSFLEGADIHAQTAARLFDVSLSQVTNEQRQLGKRINFSILYGLTPYGLSKDLDIPLSDAKKYIERYFAQHPGVSAWMEKVIEQTVAQGYVETVWGRRRYIPGIYEKNKVLYDQARRVAINTVSQGTAAEIMKKGMLDLHAVLKRDFPQVYMVLQIHDELLISVPRDMIYKIEPVVKEILEKVVTWTVPLVVSTRVGADWKEVTK